MEIDIEDGTQQMSVVQEEKWFVSHEKIQDNIIFDKNQHYTLTQFKAHLEQPGTHIIAPLFSECYQIYQDIIKGGENVIYIQDLIKPLEEANQESDQGLIPLPKSKQIQGKIHIHIVFLGNSFIDSYYQIKKQQSVPEMHPQIQQNIQILKENQQSLLKTYMDEHHFNNTFINYEFQQTPQSYDALNFPYFAQDIIKLLYLFRKQDVVLRQYDLPTKMYVSQLEQHLSFI